MLKINKKRYLLNFLNMLIYIKQCPNKNKNSLKQFIY